jgi:hypothetical protein
MSASCPSTDDLDDWASLSGLSLGSPTGSSGPGLAVVPSLSSSQPSPALTTTSSGSSTGEYNAFSFVGGLAAGEGNETQLVDLSHGYLGTQALLRADRKFQVLHQAD